MLMHLLLDQLNRRKVDYNTVEGAKELAHILLADNPDRLNHTLQVVTNCEVLSKLFSLTKEQNQLLLTSAYLHDVGYNRDFVISNFHPFDGYNYLKANDWDLDVCLLVLHHSEASTLYLISNSELYEYYEEKIPEHLLTIYKLLTIADMKSNSKGELVTFNKRLKDICERYGDSHPITKHAETIISKSKEWLYEMS